MTPEMLRRQLKLRGVMGPERFPCLYYPVQVWHSCTPLCSQESAAARARPWPTWNSSSTLSPSFRTYPYTWWCHPQTYTSSPGLRLCHHPTHLWVMPPVPLCACYQSRKESLRTELCPHGQLHPPPLISLNSNNRPKRRHYCYCHVTTDQQESPENIELYVFYVQ